MEQEDGYLLDNRRAEAGLRFEAMAELFDEWTFRHLDELGVQAGWRCWEVGAGGPAVPRWLAERGADLGYGRKLPRLLREAGLTDIRADAYFPITSPAGGLLEAATVSHLRRQLIDHHHATETDIDRHLAAIAAGRLDLTTAPLISAWGRRP